MRVCVMDADVLVYLWFVLSRRLASVVLLAQETLECVWIACVLGVSSLCGMRGCLSLSGVLAFCLVSISVHFRL